MLVPRESNKRTEGFVVSRPGKGNIRVSGRAKGKRKEGGGRAI